MCVFVSQRSQEIVLLVVPACLFLLQFIFSTVKEHNLKEPFTCLEMHRTDRHVHAASNKTANIVVMVCGEHLNFVFGDTKGSTKLI